MKKFIFTVIIAAFLSDLYSQNQDWDHNFDDNDLYVEVDVQNGWITYNIAHTLNNTGCTWNLQNDPSTTPSTNPMNIRIRESGQSWTNIGTGLSNGNFTPDVGFIAGINQRQSANPLTNNGATDISDPRSFGIEYVIRFDNLNPKYFDGTVDFEVSGFWKSSAPGCNGNAGANQNATKVIGIPAIPNVSNISTVSYCDKVRINWTIPNTWAKRRTRIFRDGTLIIEAPNNFTAFDDFGASPGVAHNYEVQSVMLWDHSRVYESPKISASGTRLQGPDEPGNIFIDQVNCNGALEVNWTWSASTNPDRFIIQRSNNSNFTNVTQFQTSGSDRFYRDATSQIGQNYHFRVIAQNDCPNSSSVINSSLNATGNEAGLGIPAAPSAVNLTVDTIGKKITVNWSDNSSMEDGFKVVRQSSLGQVEFDVAANATSYVDNSAQTCETYTYSIKAYNTCKTTGVLSTGPTGSASAYIPSDLGTVFNGTSDRIQATDGEFGDRIELRWSTPNRQVDFWNIQRINPLTNDTVLIGSPSGRTKFFSDNTADANTFYDYLIQGETDCAGNIEFSNKSKDYGFRLAFGTVNGQVTYKGGVAVEGVKVTAEPASGASGKTGAFNGTSSLATVQNDEQLHLDSFTVQSYFYPESLTGRQVIASKSSATQGFQFGLNNNQLELWVNGQSFTVTDTSIKAQKWISATAVLSVDSIKLFVNNKFRAGFANNQTPVDSTNSLLLGKSNSGNYFHGNIDELRIYNRPLSDLEVLRSFDVYINPSSKGLVGYWRFDEGFGTVAYDYSKTLLTPNRNHAQMTNVSFSNNKPSTTQLTAGAYTNSNGSYFIPFIPFLGSGDNFILTPTFGTHQFSPATTTILIGTGSQNYTGQNFEDQSSFSVSGTVKYKNTNCFVKEARLLIDGQVVIRNGEVAETDANGFFDIQVPIGPHVVTVEKTSHDFSAGRFPTNGAFDFQQNVQGIDFIDSTLVKIVGRIAGGSIQKSLPPALGRGKNNIGVASIPFKAQQGSGCLVDTAITNLNTGEYEVYLPPLRYEIPNFSISSNAAIQFINNNLLDISTVPPVQTATDSVFKKVNNRNVLDKIDSANFQRQLDFIHYVSPEVNVIGENNPAMYGADAITFENSGAQLEIPTDSLGLTYPVFEENKEYTWLISAFEIYENKDFGIVKDSVPMTEGRVIINNNLSNQTQKIYDYAITDTLKFNGIQEYTFTAGQANTNVNSLNPDYSYTKTCEVTLTPDNGNAVTWKPNSSDPINQDFRGIVFGGRALGNSFATQGPQVVTMILRDPPGTNSSSTWEQGTSVTNSYQYSTSAGLGAKLGGDLKSGTKFSVGLGYTTETEIEASASGSVSSETSIGGGGELIEKVTNSVGLSTGNTDNFVGANADLFFGRSMNMDFGLSQVLSLVEDFNCNGNCGSAVYNFNGRNFRIGTTVSMFVIPQGYETEFVFTQSGIENLVIPRLENLRNQLLMNNPLYVSNLPASDPKYGTSNDDEDHGGLATIDVENSNLEDSTGVSYTYFGYTRIDTVIFSQIFNIPKNITYYDGVDSVWWYNKQIRLWEQTLEENERAKVLAKNNDLSRNISYQGGNSVTYTSSTSKSESTSKTLNFNLAKSDAITLGAEIGGNGISVTAGTSINITTNSTRGTTNETTSTFSYTISDSDPVDDFSVDVFNAADGFGPIFKTRGGQTSCPYQGETKTKYYQPGTVLDKATIQLEDPGISASPTQVFNVPANAAANFTLNLSHGGPFNNVYEIRVMENSNPNGAILEIDGLPPSRDFAIPAQSTISKTLTVEKGPNHISYDSIGLILVSKCQYAFNTPGYDDIADTIYISVDFLPSCTEIKVQSPQNQFTANNSFSNTLPVVISGYDINYSGLEKIELQYKPSNQASWIPLGREWFKDTVDINNRYPNHIDPQQIPRGQSYITYQLEMDQLIDQDYDLRAISTCKIPFNPDFSQESAVISGIFDRVNPHPFGSPSPADGVLDPNDDISIRFNEPIEAGSLSPNNFQITGVLNGQELRHDKAIAFNGTTEYLEIDNGFDFASNNFTIEFWLKRSGLGSKQTIISQGNNQNNTFAIGFESNNEMSVQVGSHKYQSDFTILDDSLWHHYTITYDKSNLNLEITDRLSGGSRVSVNNNFFSSFISGGKTFIGKNALNNSDYFNGSIHQFRIWNRALSFSQVSSRINQNLGGREAGLVGFWPMDEGRGNLAEDKARFRNAEMNAEWEINPKSTASTFDGISQYVVVDTAGTLAITQEMDLSIELWFKTAGGKLQTLLSNGSGRFAFGDNNQNGWNIEMNAQNEIWVRNDSFAFKAVDKDFADDSWHHFALVVNRLANATTYIDGVQQKSTTATNFWGFSGSKFAIGARFYLNGTVENIDQFYDGEIDEVRIWNTALLRENIELNRYNRLKGNEFGLIAYYPFESYRLELGVPVLDASNKNQSTVLRNPERTVSKQVGGTLNTTTSPSVALQRPVEEIKFSWSVNNDEIVITPNEDAANIENVTLNVSVQGVKDLHGNLMQSPKTWIAFVNKNQVIWQDLEKNLSKEFNDTMTFTSKIVNSGGELKTFSITNIPAWLSVSPSSGSINPLTAKTIKFTINSGINIGDYTEDLLLNTDFGYAEKLFVNLKVRKTAPDFSFNEAQYNNTMNVVGQIRINGNVSVNDEDQLIAFVGDSIRGATPLKYVESLDAYIAFLDVYGSNQDSVYFKVWNSREGELHEEVTPSLTFINNQIIGSLLQPQVFDAVNKISKPIILKRGWNWVSFPLANDNMRSISHFMSDLNFEDGDVIKTRGNNTNANYGGKAFGWVGGLTAEGLKNEKSYLIHISNRDTIDFKGFQIDPDTIPISVVKGWNRISFVSLKNMDINTALANFNATDGDLIKGQQSFALYLSSLGWVGSLSTLEPTEGYLLKSANSATFTYPRRGLFRLKEEPSQQKLAETLPALYTLNPNDFEASTNAIVKINTCEEVLENSDWALAAFKGEELRGYINSTQLVNEELGHEYFITVFGEGEETFTFKMINKVNGEEMAVTSKLDFEKNQVQGEIENPLKFDLLTEVDCDQFKKVEEISSVASEVNGTYPNPFTNFLTIVIPQEISANGTYSIIDETGKVQYSEKVGDRELIQLNGAQLRRLSSGVYQLKFVDGDSIISEKLVKIK